MTTTLEHLAFRIAKLNVGLEKAAGKARIPGDGDGDGIPHEGRQRRKRLPGTPMQRAKAALERQAAARAAQEAQGNAASDRTRAAAQAGRIADSRAAQAADAAAAPKAPAPSKGNQFAGRNKAGDLERYYSEATGGSVTQAIPKTSNIDRALNPNNARPWFSIGAKDRDTLDKVIADTTQFKNGSQNDPKGAEFRDAGKSEVKALISAAFKAGGGKGDLSDDVADKIASRFTEFKGLKLANSDREDFKEMNAGTYAMVAAAAFAHGRQASKPK